MKKRFLFIMCFCLLMIGISLNINLKDKDKINNLTGKVLNINNENVTIQDDEDIIYTFNIKKHDIDVGDKIIIKYTGVIDKNNHKQHCKVINYNETKETIEENGIPTSYLDDGIFSDYYVMAYNKLKTLSLDEKIGQLLLVRYPDNNQIEDLKKYKFSGFVFYEKDFKDKTKNEVINMIENLEKNSSIPLLTSVDEEGGKIIRISSNSNLIDTPFKSPSELYNNGGFTKIKEDTKYKSEILHSLGLNVNLAPVVDVSTNSNDYIYERTLKQDTNKVSDYAKTVIEASKGTNVSYVLKHFPGYGNNSDTHISSSTSSKSYEDLLKYDIPPFKSGIDVGAEAILVSHNIVSSIDSSSPASLSINNHNILRDDLNFTGVILADDLDMGALDNISNKSLKALLAGNNLIITTDYKESFNEIKSAINNNELSEDTIDKLVFKVLAWKYYKGLFLSK
ncbi:MAG: beta-hexosaminidase [Lactobacillales bacterium]|nr:beta-hexosaminidase [Lactobacillales bacterium]